MRHLTVSSLLAVVGFCLATNYTCSQTEQVEVTFYGFPDNSPPGAGIDCTIQSRSDCSGTSTCTNAYNALIGILQSNVNCGPRGETAGGTGTYDDPLTMASAGNYFCFQEVVYLPYLQKYLRYEDYCQQCIKDVPNGIHIDIWTGSNTTNGGNAQLNCENELTPSSLQDMIRNPSSDLPVDSKCHKWKF